nr:PREDICTED: uncharacterized protein LOC104246004 isoform X2 [Nicotiana sylvestris]
MLSLRLKLHIHLLVETLYVTHNPSFHLHQLIESRHKMAFQLHQLIESPHRIAFHLHQLTESRHRMERIEEILRQRPETRAEISPNDALGVVFGPEHPGRVRGLGMGAVPTVVFKQTSRQGGCSYMSAASTSAPPPQWVQEMANMRSQLNALTSLFQMKIGNIPRSLLTYFRLLHSVRSILNYDGEGRSFTETIYKDATLGIPRSAPNLGDGVPSPTGPRRSFDGSNYENGANNN